MLIDKTYVRARDMLFNVTGYHHPNDAVYASLKYVGGEKWKKGYEAARHWLSEFHPEFVDEYIQVPIGEIANVYEPQSRWRELLDNAPSDLAALHREAIELASQLSTRLEIPLEDFGITDSLLWGDGHSESDIDLVVFSTKYVRHIQDGGADLYSAANRAFARPNPQKMTAPYSYDVEDWPSILARKLHMGCYRGRLFSLRVVLTEAELAVLPRETKRNTVEKRTIEFEVSDTRYSLCFPAVYRDASNNDLVDYSVVYEGVFRPGDRVRAACWQEEITYDSGQTNTRYVIADPITVSAAD